MLKFQNISLFNCHKLNILQHCVVGNQRKWFSKKARFLQSLKPDRERNAREARMNASINNLIQILKINMNELKCINFNVWMKIVLKSVVIFILWSESFLNIPLKKPYKAPLLLTYKTLRPYLSTIPTLNSHFNSHLNSHILFSKSGNSVLRSGNFSKKNSHFY